MAGPGLALSPRALPVVAQVCTHARSRASTLQLTCVPLRWEWEAWADLSGLPLATCMHKASCCLAWPPWEAQISSSSQCR